MKFLVLNKTSNPNLSELLKDKLVNQTTYIDNIETVIHKTVYNQEKENYAAGFLFDKFISNFTEYSFNLNGEYNLGLIYNDSALLSFPYLINYAFNFISKNIDNGKMFNASIAAWPKTDSDCGYFTFDVSSFSSFMILGFAFIFPIASFGSEIVQDRGSIFY